MTNSEQGRYGVRFNIKYGADVIKTCASGGMLSPADDVDVPQLNVAEMDLRAKAERVVAAGRDGTARADVRSTNRARRRRRGAPQSENAREFALLLGDLRLPGG